MIIKNNIGIMQGRLLPKYKDKFQAHPVGYWDQEFNIVNNLGLDCIEFILDYDLFEMNPLMNSKGIKKIRKVEDETGIKVTSICADYFMKAPIHSNDFNVVDKSISVLEKLINNASQLNISDIIIPCVDQSSLKNKKDIDNFVNNIKTVLNTAEINDINICLETDLEPKVFSKMLDAIGSKNITVNYDTGNSAANGYDPIEEFNAYGDRITDLHIKDRKFKGQSVPLGTGNVEFNKIFDLLSKYEYKGIIIFQAFRDKEGLNIFKKQKNWFFKNVNQFSI